MKVTAPYQILFPLGLLNAFLAVGVWLTQDFGWFSTPALFIHSKLIVGGFVWSFIVGFLMTAVPRMTGTASANRLEYCAAVTLILLQMVFSWSLNSDWFYGSAIMLVLFIVIYAGRRLIIMQKSPPIFFSHIGMAMALAALGALFHLNHKPTIGFHLYHVGTILLLVLGIGTRFFSFLSGLPAFFEAESTKLGRLLFHGLGLLTATFLFLGGMGYPSAYLGLTLTSLIYLFFIWRVHRSSLRQSALKYGVRLVAAAIPVSFFLAWLRPDLLVTWLHILFIGCFGVITFSVATRVTLAHGSYPVDLETRSPSLWWMMAFFLLALLTRIFYGLSTAAWRTELLYLAALFWIVAVAIWCSAFFMRILVPGDQDKPAC